MNTCLPRYLFLLSLTLLILGLSAIPTRLSAQTVIPEQITNMFQEGRTFSGVKIPSYTDKDELQMVLEADTITRVDAEFLDITNLVIRIYQDGKVASTVQMEEAKYHIINATLTNKTTKKRPRINHESFVMTGDRMIVNTKTQVNTMRGDVRTVIFEADKFTGSMKFGK